MGQALIYVKISVRWKNFIETVLSGKTFLLDLLCGGDQNV